jgi:hypothetical protein
MEVSDQFHALAAAGWAPESSLHTVEKRRTLYCQESNPGHPALKCLLKVDNCLHIFLFHFSTS